MTRLRCTACIMVLWLLSMLAAAHAQKPPLTLDDFSNAVSFPSVQISPDGHAVVVETRRADWSANRFRNELWLYRDDGGGSLVQLTQSGHDSAPQWSPDGRWIAFLSNREKDVAQVYVISASGGEALPVTSGDEGIHAFAWSADSRRLYFATRTPWTKAQKDADAEEWRDVIRFREGERGDTVFSIDATSPAAPNRIHTGQRAEMPVAEKLQSLPYLVRQMAVSPDGRLLAIATGSPSGRMETPEPYGIYVADLPAGTSHLAIHTQSFVNEIQWATDSRHVLFTYSGGTPEGPYQDLQTRLYWVDVAGGRAVRWASNFTGGITESYSLAGFTVLQNGTALAVGRLGTEAQPYTESDPDAEFVKQPAWAGTYEMLSAARESPRVAFVYSSLQRPREVYVAESPERLQQAKPITAFNQLFTQRELPQGKPYRWTADDGTPVEGMLIYPPGKFEAKRLPMLTYIGGGDGTVSNDFDLYWADGWEGLAAATQGWLVFEPNYRGSPGYGDAFMLASVGHYNSRPGKDILEGVDALVKEGIADPDELTIGGYSSGGFHTNWLITQTTRFKAAVTGAGIVEWAGLWGGSYGPLYTAYWAGGVPWEAEANYKAESAIWQAGKITTPTHIVTGSEDAAVPPFEAHLLEQALQTRGVPHRLLIFPGEGHGLGKNPWHGKIKLREELKWLEKYGRKKR